MRTSSFPPPHAAPPGLERAFGGNLAAQGEGRFVRGGRWSFAPPPSLGSSRFLSRKSIARVRRRRGSSKGGAATAGSNPIRLDPRPTSREWRASSMRGAATAGCKPIRPDPEPTSREWRASSKGCGATDAPEPIHREPVPSLRAWSGSSKGGGGAKLPPPLESLSPLSARQLGSNRDVWCGEGGEVLMRLSASRSTRCIRRGRVTTRQS
jgi:hypothetical protein